MAKNKTEIVITFSQGSAGTQTMFIGLIARSHIAKFL